MNGTLEKQNVTFGRLKELERVIERGKQTFVDVGLALAEIRDSRLYRKDFSTFEDYCRGRWGWERAHAYRLIDAAQVVKELSPVGDVKVLPIESERQARELAKIKNPVLRSQVWHEVSTNATETKSTITANSIKEVVKKHIQIHTSDSLQSRESDGMEIIYKLNEIRRSLTESQKIFDFLLADCVRDIKHNCTLTDKQREEIVLFAVEESHAHAIEEIAEDCRLAESDVKTIVNLLVKQDLVESRERFTVGGSKNQTLIYSKRKPCSCV